MVKLYTATGTYKLTEDGMPTVISGGRECALDTHELLLWSILAFRILTYQEARAEFYRKERELHILSDADFDHYLNRLTVRRLAASGTDERGVDALYDLLGRLTVEEIPSGFPAKAAAFLKLLFLRRLPFRKAVSVLRRTKLEPDEKKILSLIRHRPLSTAELVQYAEKGTAHNPDGERRDLVFADGRTTDARYPVLTAVSNLYFKQQITLQIL